MMEKIKAWIRKNEWLRRICSGVYRNTVYLAKIGYFQSMFRYFLKIAGPEKKKLRSLGFEKIKAYKSKTWRIGKGLDGAMRRYYMACYRGQKVFVKVAKHDATIRNEIAFAEYLQDRTPSFVCPAVLWDRTFAQETMMLAIEFTEGLSSLTLPRDPASFTALCDSFYDILEQLNALQIVHADIHKNNLMRDANGNLVLLDFGISVIRGVENGIDYVARPGTFYRSRREDQRIYDDAWSFLRQMDAFGLPEEWKQTESYRRIEDAVGRNQVVVRL